MASILILDEAGRIYPAPAHRIAPDFDFQSQVYRADGETIRLPEGRYTVMSCRGPEYICKTRTVDVVHSSSPEIKITLERWINAARLGWYPGDTHIHAAGCAHYETPAVGVTPETLIRHVRGEALAIGAVLTWGPGYNYQKKFFSGRVYKPRNVLEHPELQRANNSSLKPRGTPRDNESMIRYDIETSGFPSSHSGHLVLLGLRDQDYPGAVDLRDWPSWNLPILQWAKAQGALVGYAHSGTGMFTKSEELPNWEIPPFDSVGANEFIVDIAHGAVDFVSGCQFGHVGELNFWYHTLNCGFRAAMLGETDFPCIGDSRVGSGRTYVGLERPPLGDAGYAAWIDGIRRGRIYFGDGRSHLIDYRINGRGVGGGDVQLERPGLVKLTARVAARLDEVSAASRSLKTQMPWHQKLPMWHIEYARINDSRKVAVEVVVNGMPVMRKEILADGSLVDFVAEVGIERSSWVALRILPSSHTYPIFISVADKPIRVSARSAQWCLDCIDVLWKEKSPRIATSEINAAEAAYDHARVVYRGILNECQYD